MCAIGPHIRAEAFVVGADVRDTFLEKHPYAVDGAGSRVDLAKVVVNQAAACGLTMAQIDDVGGCTYSDAKKFFSHRRDAGKTGRHLSAIAVRGETA